MVTQQLPTIGLTHISYRQPLRPHLYCTINSLPRGVTFLAASIAVSFLALILSVHLGAVISSGAVNSSDPFAPYRSILPGQPAAALDNYDCLRAYDRNLTPPCSILPDGGPFHLVLVTTRQDTIVELSFFSQTLQLGDLIHPWGEPTSMHRNEHGRAITLIWSAGTNVYSATMALRGTQPHVRVVTARLSCEGANAGACS
jgi:hypothetical protein